MEATYHTIGQTFEVQFSIKNLSQDDRRSLFQALLNHYGIIGAIHNADYELVHDATDIFQILDTAIACKEAREVEEDNRPVLP